MGGGYVGGRYSNVGTEMMNSAIMEEASHRILDRFYELGGNFIDTANTYADGHSEEVIGNWLSRSADLNSAFSLVH